MLFLRDIYDKKEPELVLELFLICQFLRFVNNFAVANGKQYVEVFVKYREVGIFAHFDTARNVVNLQPCKNVED